MAQKVYKSIIEEMIKQLEDQEPPYRVHSIENDKIKFGFPENLKMTLGQQLASFAAPNGRNAPFKPTERQSATYGNQTESGAHQLETKPSSTIQQAAYWPNKQYLLVSFKSGHTYSYDRVPLKVVLSWEQSASAGSYFYYNIRTKYSYKKVG